MKLLHFPTVLLFAVAVFALPAAGQAKDRDDRHDHDRDSHDNRRASDVRGHDRDHDHDRYSSDHRYHEGHYYGGRSYGYPYRYGYDYPYDGPSFGVTYDSSPRSVYTSRAYDDSDDTAIDVQRALKRRGYYRGTIDGDVGPGTRSAIRAYQYDRRLPESGRIDGPLLRSLGV